MSDSPSQLWKDRYLIEKELARGGFGVVYLARDQQLLSKSVVIKVLIDDVNPDPYIQKKFRQEIEALARIDHPGIVGILDVGDTPEGKPFIVMQFVEGVTLRSQIDKGAIPLQMVARVMRQIGNALTAAHEKGVLHRDLKPENIMLQTLGDGEIQVKLIDFGIAGVKDSKVDHTQLTSKVAGTLSYMAPEQVLGHASQASDLYALGVIAFEMLTGARPENSPQGVLKKPRELRPDLGNAAEALILRALSYRPEQRQSRVREFTDQLAEGLGDNASAYAPIATAKSEPAGPSARLEMAYVLFMDLVDYSKLPMDQQTSRIQQLQTVVRGTAEFREASASEQLISLPTGDGMALVFFQNPVTPVQCATAIARALRQRQEIRLRMGVHTGPVYRIADINANHNVTGGGINLAQRVMDCGDAGHILLSKTFADVLVQLSDWADSLHDIGEVAVKHGANVHLVNLYSADFGNPDMPSKVAAARSAPTPPKAARKAAPAPAPPPERTVVASEPRGRSGMMIGIGVAAAVVIAAAVFYFGFMGKPPQGELPKEDAQAAAPAAAATTPPAEKPAPSAAAAAPPKASEPAKTEEAPAKQPETSQTEKPQPTTPAPAIADAKAAEPVAVTTSPTATPQPPPANNLGPRQGGGRRGQLQPGQVPPANAMRQRVQRLEQRAQDAQQSIQTVTLPPQARKNIADARGEFLRLMKEGTTALNNGDLETAEKDLNLANQEMFKVENILQRATAPRRQ